MYRKGLGVEECAKVEAWATVKEEDVVQNMEVKLTDMELVKVIAVIAVCLILTNMAIAVNPSDMSATILARNIVIIMAEAAVIIRY